MARCIHATIPCPNNCITSRGHYVSITPPALPTRLCSSRFLLDIRFLYYSGCIVHPHRRPCDHSILPAPPPPMQPFHLPSPVA
jgi:hypothetical protein